MPASRFLLTGVVHLPPLPGTARGEPAPTFPHLLERVKRDAITYAAAGFDRLIVENFGDVPFRRDAVEAQTVAAMTLAVAAAKEASGIPVGINVLRNDVLSAVAIAALAGGSFVRANIYVGSAVTDQGLIEGRAHEVQALIRRLGAAIDVWADIDVKHAAPLASRPIGELAADAVERGLASALIVTGPATGLPVLTADLRAARAAVPKTPLYVGSGVTAERLAALRELADGAIIGTGAKVDGIVTNPVDPVRAKALVAAARAG